VIVDDDIIMKGREETNHSPTNFKWAKSGEREKGKTAFLYLHIQTNLALKD
jgi:hypothetical protein